MSNLYSYSSGQLWTICNDAGEKLCEVTLFFGQPWLQQLQRELLQVECLTQDEGTLLLWNDFVVYPKPDLLLVPENPETFVLTLLQQERWTIKICVGEPIFDGLPAPVMFELQELTCQVNRTGWAKIWRIGDVIPYIRRLGHVDLSLLAEIAHQYLSSLPLQIIEMNLDQFMLSDNMLMLPLIVTQDGALLLSQTAMHGPVVGTDRSQSLATKKIVTRSESLLVQKALIAVQDKCLAREKSLQPALDCLLTDHYEMKKSTTRGCLGRALQVLCGRECCFRLFVSRDGTLPSRVLLEDVLALTFETVPETMLLQDLIVKDALPHVEGPCENRVDRGAGRFVEYVVDPKQAMQALAVLPVSACCDGTRIPLEQRCLLLRTVGYIMGASTSDIRCSLKTLVARNL